MPITINLPPVTGGDGTKKKKGGSSGPKYPGSPGGADYYGFYLGIMQGLGIGINKAVLDFAHHANTQHWSSGTFMYYLRQTAFYHAEFPGIMGQNNTLRMSEQQYISEYNSLNEQSQNIGIQFSKAHFGQAIAKGLQPGTIFARISAIQRVKENPVAFKQFQDVLHHRGLIKGPLKRSELWDTALGMSSQAWYKAAEQAYLQTSAAESGLRIGSDITRREIHRLAVSIPGFQGESDLAKNFTQLAQQFKQLKQLSPAVGLTVPRKYVYALEFGGPLQQEAAARIQNVIDSYAGAFEPSAAGNLQQSGTGGTVQTGFEQYSG